MNWHYEDNGSQEGPYSESEMKEFIAAGVIRAETLIWSDGHEDWFPASNKFDFDVTAAVAAVPVQAAVAPPPLTDTTSEVSEELDDDALALLENIRAGGRYVYYSYTISILIMTFNRSSKVMYVPSGKSRLLPGLPYAMVSLLFGWWGFPFGIIFTPISLVRSLAGGTDVTSDLISEELLEEHRITTGGNGLRLFLASVVVLGSMIGLFYWLISMVESSA